MRSALIIAFRTSLQCDKLAADIFCVAILPKRVRKAKEEAKRAWKLVSVTACDSFIAVLFFYCPFLVMLYSNPTAMMFNAAVDVRPDGDTVTQSSLEYRTCNIASEICLFVFCYEC